MAKSLITDYFRLHNVNQFRESINETANSVYYVFAGTHLTYPSGDSTIPDQTNSVDGTLYDPYDEMVFGKRVSANDVCGMVPRYNWTSNTLYSAYRSDEDLTDKEFYVVVEEAAFNVFKCLDNNGNAASMYAPALAQTSANDEFYSTADGYVWKYMYSVDTTTFNKFATATLMPVVANTAVTGNAVSGAIDVIAVSYRGSNYNTFLANTFTAADIAIGGDTKKFNLANYASASNNFYKDSFLYITTGTGYGQGRKIVDYVVIGNDKTITLESAFDVLPDSSSVYEITPYVLITGDGSNAVARALVDTSVANTISGIEIVSRGASYTYAVATIQGNTGGVSNAAVLNVVLGPKGGHGSNPEYELGCRSLCISTTFANTEGNTIPVTNDYRSVGLLKDPLYRSVEITVSSPTGSFEIGEIVSQANTNATGEVADLEGTLLTLTNVAGVFVTGETITGATTTFTANVASFLINNKAKGFGTFDQRHRYTYTLLSGTDFTIDEGVYQTILEDGETVIFGRGNIHAKDNDFIYLTHETGTINTGNTIVGQTSTATANVLFYYPPDLVKGSGEVLYVENMSAISRSNSQSETIKLILQF